ncbi:MAG: ATP-binding protein, partial [Acidimicrobiales bacterium]
MTTGARRLVSTVRFRVTAIAALAVLVTLVIAGIALVVAQRRLLTENVEEGIEQAADSIEAAVEDDGMPAVLGGFGDDDTVAQVVTPSGEVVAATANVEGLPPIADAPPDGDRQQQRTVDDIPADDAPFRVLSRRVDGQDGTMIVHVGATLDDVEESTNALAASLAVAIPSVALLLAGVIWWLTGRTLRPVEAIRAEVAAIGGAELDRRVGEPGTGDEIDRLAATMNAMLERIERAARQQQQFVADASHELRSPLTRIRSELEVDLAHPGGADLAATHRSVLEETAGLQRLVEDLLHLARSDAGAVAPRDETVDLDDVVLDVARRLRGEGRVRVDTSRVHAVQVRGDAAQLARAVGNLAENAERHAVGRVTLSLAEDGGAAVLTVADDGPGIPAAQSERIFERFTRLDEARTGAAGGTGLGLAIARDVIAHHGGTVTVDPDRGPG